MQNFDIEVQGHQVSRELLLALLRQSHLEHWVIRETKSDSIFIGYCKDEDAWTYTPYLKYSCYTGYDTLVKARHR